MEVVGVPLNLNNVCPIFHIKLNAAARSFATTPSLESKLPALHELGSVDHSFEEDRIDRVAEPERRAFTYLMLSTVRFAYASTARLLVVKFVASMSASAEVLALAFSEFDLSEVPLGETITVKWRGKPVFIRHRTEEEIAEESIVPMAELRDQENDTDRCIKPEFMIVLGICVRINDAFRVLIRRLIFSNFFICNLLKNLQPHLGCVPTPMAGDYNGWFCPCHGSHYDTSGRIRKGPSPLNLEVPPYKFIEENVILMG
jgi:ubiquinol-cytochrome c reductase iron-sulfur subunit